MVKTLRVTMQDALVLRQALRLALSSTQDAVDRERIMVWHDMLGSGLGLRPLRLFPEDVLAKLEAAPVKARPF